MSPESSRRASLEGSETPYQTDSKSGSWDLSRWNSCKWQTRREDIMVCLGDKCRYRFCQYEDDELPPVGSECPFETWFGWGLVNEFDRMFPRDKVGRYMDDYDHQRKEFVLAHLLANRASIRASLTLQRCFDAVQFRGNMPIDRKPFQEHALAERYRTAAYNRVNAVWAQLPIISARLREARIRMLMIAHGYYRPLEGDDPPQIPEDAPAWILEEVDGKRSA